MPANVPVGVHVCMHVSLSAIKPHASQHSESAKALYDYRFIFYDFYIMILITLFTGSHWNAWASERAACKKNAYLTNPLVPNPTLKLHLKEVKTVSDIIQLNYNTEILLETIFYESESHENRAQDGATAEARSVIQVRVNSTLFVPLGSNCANMVPNMYTHNITRWLLQYCKHKHIFLWLYLQ